MGQSIKAYMSLAAGAAGAFLLTVTNATLDGFPWWGEIKKQAVAEIGQKLKAESVAETPDGNDAYLITMPGWAASV